MNGNCHSHKKHKSTTRVIGVMIRFGFFLVQPNTQNGAVYQLDDKMSHKDTYGSFHLFRKFNKNSIETILV